METPIQVFQGTNKQFINGEWRDGASQKTAKIYDPFDNSVFTEVVLANQKDIDDAYQAAANAQRKWKNASKVKRVEVIEKAIAIMEEHKDELVETFIRETGSSTMKASVEVHLALGILNEAKTFPYRMEEQAPSSNIPGKENYIFREPVGVVGVISPFNVPFHLSMRSIAPAIACGNAVVHKPDLQTAISGGGLIGRIFEMAGLPKGVLNIIMPDISDIGDAFIEHPVPRVISFTGSTAVGRHIAEVAGRHLKKVSLELGGNSPFIVLSDADIDQAVNAAIFGKFMHQGQICMGTNRFLIQRTCYEEFTTKFVERASKLTFGDPKNPENIIGPIINEKQIQKILTLINTAKTEGATVALEGKRIGNIITPWVLKDVDNDMTIAQSEIFGPVACMISFEEEEEAIEMANATAYGLSASVFTSDIEKGAAFARNIESGMCHVNDQTINDDPKVAFGGEKASGIGRFGGRWVMDSFTTVKWVSIQKEYREFPF